MPATYLAHPVEDRTLSVQEYARLQMFPDDWKFAGNLIDKYKQIGNAVPVGFGKAVGSHLIAFDQGLLNLDQQVAVPLSRYRNTDHVKWQAAISKNQLPLFIRQRIKKYSK